MILAGVDPGAYGAVVWINSKDLKIIAHLDMPTYIEKVRTSKKVRVDAQALAAELRRNELLFPTDEAVIEKVAARQQQGVSSMFAFGKAAGILEGVFAGIGIPFRTLRPQEWQRLARVQGGEHIKDNARDRAAMLFPGRADLFGRKKDSGRADAALIAYARAVELGHANPK